MHLNSYGKTAAPYNSHKEVKLAVLPSSFGFDSPCVLELLLSWSRLKTIQDTILKRHRIPLEKKISLRKGVLATVIFVWSLFFIQNAFSADSSNENTGFLYSSYFQGELLEDVPLDKGYTSPVKKAKYFQPRITNHSTIVSPIVPQAATKIAVAPWNWPQHSEYSFLFRLTPF